eukprot:scpid111053/ scgid10296/ 
MYGWMSVEHNDPMHTQLYLEALHIGLACPLLVTPMAQWDHGLLEASATSFHAGKDDIAKRLKPDNNAHRAIGATEVTGHNCCRNHQMPTIVLHENTLQGTHLFA